MIIVTWPYYYQSLVFYGVDYNLIKVNDFLTACIVPNLDCSMRVPFAVVDGDTLDVVADGVGYEVVLAPPPLVVFLRRSLQRNLLHICS